MATARVAAGSVLDTVTAISNTASAAVNTVGDSILMLSAFVTKHRTMQTMSIKIELDSYENRLVEDTALETEKRRIEIQKFFDAHPDNVKSYSDELKRLKSILRSDEKENSSN